MPTRHAGVRAPPAPPEVCGAKDIPTRDRFCNTVRFVVYSRQPVKRRRPRTIRASRPPAISASVPGSGDSETPSTTPDVGQGLPQARS